MKKYDDIINLEHFHAEDKPFMSNSERSAQFMPFKALNGFEESISESSDEIFDDKWQEIDSSDAQNFPEY